MKLFDLYENLFAEEETPASKQAKEKNLHHLGHGVYTSKPDGQPEFRSVDSGQRLERIPPQQQAAPSGPKTSPAPAASPTSAPEAPTQPKTIKNNTFDRNMARLRAIPDDQFPGGHEGKRKAEQRLLKKWDNHLNAKAQSKGQDREAQFKDTSDFPGGADAYQQTLDRISQKYGEIPDWSKVSARSEIPDATGQATSLADMIPGYEEDPSTSSSPTSPQASPSPAVTPPQEWPTPPASPIATPAPAASPASPTPASSGTPLDKMMQHFGGDTNKVRDTLQKRIDFHTSNPSDGSEEKIKAAQELMAQLEPQASSTSSPMLSPMVPSPAVPSGNTDPVSTPPAQGAISTDPKVHSAAKKQLISAMGDYDAARGQLAKRIAKATTPEEKKKIAQIAQALSQMEKEDEENIAGFADKIKQKQQAGVAQSRQKYAMARDNPNKGL